MSTAEVPLSKKPPSAADDAAAEESPSAVEESPSAAEEPAPKVTATQVNAMSIKAAKFIRPYLDKATPALVAVGNLIDLAEPYFFAAVAYLQHVWLFLQPYHPHEFLPAITGFVLVFFGGNFFTLCAAVEAYRLVGFDETKAWRRRGRREEVIFPFHQSQNTTKHSYF